MQFAAILCVWVLSLTGVYLVSRRLATRRRSRERLLDPDEAPASASTPSVETAGPLQRWLLLAGFRAPEAPRVFLGATAVTTLLGLLIAYALFASGLLRQASRATAEVPGGLGDLLLPLIYVAPWVVLLTFGSLPTLMVRAARRKRVAEVEEDLPITLELLAMLSEAGLGFDAALERVLGSQPADRPLTQELRTFQMEVLAGRPRVQCLRRLGWRVEVMPLTSFVLALVQTEQVGAGVADVLRQQAEDLRGRRRERALSRAEALPSKLMFPLVICFLPGILVVTLGPTFYQVFQMLDGIARSRGMP